MIGKKTTRSLKVKFIDIPQEGMTWNVPLERELLATITPEGANFVPGIHADVFIEPSGRNASVSGSITGDVELTCVRCLRSFSLHVNPHFSLVLIPEEESPFHRERELTRDRLDTDVYRNGEVDIEALLLEQIVLFLPSYPRCREHCKGLCPRCGADMNLGPCGCKLNEDVHATLGLLSRQFEGLRDGKVKRGGR